MECMKTAFLLTQTSFGTEVIYNELIEVSFTLKDTQQNPTSKMFSIFEFIRCIDCND